MVQRYLTQVSSRTYVWLFQFLSTGAVGVLVVSTSFRIIFVVLLMPMPNLNMIQNRMAIRMLIFFLDAFGELYHLESEYGNDKLSAE